MLLLTELAYYGQQLYLLLAIHLLLKQQMKLKRSKASYDLAPSLAPVLHTFSLSFHVLNLNSKPHPPCF